MLELMAPSRMTCSGPQTTTAGSPRRRAYSSAVRLEAARAFERALELDADFPEAEDAREQLEAKGAKFVDKPFVAHDRIATAAGCLAGIELDRWLITKLIDAETAEKCINSGSAWGQGVEQVYR